MSRRPRLSFFGLLLLSAACSSSTDGPTTDGEGSAGEGAGGAVASAGAAQVAAAGAGGAAGHAGSGAQSANAGSASGGQAGGLATGGAGAGGSGGRAVGGGGTSANGGAAGKGAGGGSGRGGSAGGGGLSASAGAGGTSCPGAGHITYTLAKSASPSATEQTAYDKIKTAMDKAITYYDCYTSITKSLSVSYVPSVETADGNINASLRFQHHVHGLPHRHARDWAHGGDRASLQLELVHRQRLVHRRARRSPVERHQRDAQQAPLHRAARRYAALLAVRHQPAVRSKERSRLDLPLPNGGRDPPGSRA